MALAFARVVVVAIVFRGDVGRVLDVDVRDVVADVFPELPRVLAWPGFGFGTIGIEDRIACVENPFETGTFVEQIEAVLPTHAAVVHAVFVHGREAVVDEHVGDFADTFENFARDDGFVVAGFIAHDADVFGAELLHPRDAAFDFARGDVERVGDFFGPVCDGGAECVNAEAVVLQFSGDDVERFVGDIVKVALGEAVDFDDAHFNKFPAEFFGGVDLGFELGACFVSDTGQNHGDNLATDGTRMEHGFFC